MDKEIKTFTPRAEDIAQRYSTCLVYVKDWVQSKAAPQSFHNREKSEIIYNTRKSLNSVEGLDGKYFRPCRPGDLHYETIHL